MRFVIKDTFYLKMYCNVSAGIQPAISHLCDIAHTVYRYIFSAC